MKILQVTLVILSLPFLIGSKCFSTSPGDEEETFDLPSKLIVSVPSITCGSLVRAPFAAAISVSEQTRDDFTPRFELGTGKTLAGFGEKFENEGLMEFEDEGGEVCFVSTFHELNLNQLDPLADGTWTTEMRFSGTCGSLENCSGSATATLYEAKSTSVFPPNITLTLPGTTCGSVFLASLTMPLNIPAETDTRFVYGMTSELPPQGSMTVQSTDGSTTCSSRRPPLPSGLGVISANRATLSVTTETSVTCGACVLQVREGSHTFTINPLGSVSWIVEVRPASGDCSAFTAPVACSATGGSFTTSD